MVLNFKFGDKGIPKRQPQCNIVLVPLLSVLTLHEGINEKLHFFSYLVSDESTKSGMQLRRNVFCR